MKLEDIRIGMKVKIKLDSKNNEDCEEFNFQLNNVEGIVNRINNNEEYPIYVYIQKDKKKIGIIIEFKPEELKEVK